MLRNFNFYAENAATVSPVYGEVFRPHRHPRKLGDDLLAASRLDGQGIGRTFRRRPLAFVGMASATNRNGWFGQVPTQARIEYRAVILLTISDGKIVRDERIYDLTPVMQCLEKVQLDKEVSKLAEVQRALWSRTERGNGFRGKQARWNRQPCRHRGKTKTAN